MTKKNAKLTMKDLEDAGLDGADLEYLEELNDRGLRKEDLGFKKMEDWEIEEYGGKTMSISDLPPELITITSNPTIKGITVRELTATLESFETPELKVEISNDAGVSYTPISMVGKDSADSTIELDYSGFNYSADEFIPEYVNRGKMVSGLIEEINCSEHPDWLIKVCTRVNDDGVSTYQLINRVIKKEDVIVLTYDETLEK